MIVNSYFVLCSFDFLLFYLLLFEIVFPFSFVVIFFARARLESRCFNASFNVHDVIHRFLDRSNEVAESPCFLLLQIHAKCGR